MKGTTLLRTLVAAALAVGLAPTLRAQDTPKDDKGAPGTAGRTADAHHGDTEVIHGIVAGVTVAGEMDVEPGTNRARLVEASYLTIVGSPSHKEGAHTGLHVPQAVKDTADRAAAALHIGRHRHNVYNVFLTPKTEVRDKTAGQPPQDAPKPGDRKNDQADTASGSNSLAHLQADLDKLEVGDRVEVVFHRRDTNKSGQNAQSSGWGRRHGRNRVYFGEAVSVNIVGGPAVHDANSAAPSGGPHDDDRDKVKNDDGKNASDKPADKK